MSGRRLHLVVVALLLVALALYLHYAAGRFRVGLLLAEVEAASLGAVSSGRLSRALLERNLRTLEQAAALAPAEVLVPIQRAGQYVIMGRPDAAVRAYEEALALEPRAEIYRNLGQVLWDRGDRELAKESFLRAVWLDHTLIRHLGKYLPRHRRTVGGSLIVYEDFEQGLFDSQGLGRKTEIMKDGFEPGSSGFPLDGAWSGEKAKKKRSRPGAAERERPEGETDG